LSFRRRLTLFFVLIVVLPMAAVAVLVSVVADDSRTGKTDARLGAGLETALALYEEALGDARADARAAGRDEALGDALRSGDEVALGEAASRLRADLGLASLAVFDRAGERIALAGSDDGIATARLDLRDAQGPIGSVTAAELSAGAYVEDAARLTGSEVAVVSGQRELASTVAVGEDEVPWAAGARDVELADGEFRVASVAPGGDDQSLRLAVFAPPDSGGFAATPPLVAGGLAAFFAVAVFFIVILLRSLQGQIREMFTAARRIRGGDFTHRVPVEGDDEMAGLASEFNQMSGQLSEQMDELRRQRVELERSVQRIGEAFASGLDRRALLEIVAETALTACDAGAARVVLDGRRRLEVVAGELRGTELAPALGAAVENALADGASAELRRAGAVALAEPLRPLGETHRRDGVIAIARPGEAFDEAEREMLRYLCGQAAVSVENIDLHELVSEQAVRDELTGLANPRRFRELIEKEAVRAERFGHELAVIMLDIDNFKQVNDIHGHLQGDEVLRMVGRILQDESRGVDEPARYGGEEFVVALPETGRKGSLEVAERIRTAIEKTPVPMVEGGGAIEVTASLGIASASPESATDTKGLIAAADAALYQAKRAGKNRSEYASSADGSIAAQGPPVERRT
jgi:diguanylate cyclase (GGDEF)-like protein